MQYNCNSRTYTSDKWVITLFNKIRFLQAIVLTMLIVDDL